MALFGSRHGPLFLCFSRARVCARRVLRTLVIRFHDSVGGKLYLKLDFRPAEASKEQGQKWQVAHLGGGQYIIIGYSLAIMSFLLS